MRNPSVRQLHPHTTEDLESGMTHPRTNRKAFSLIELVIVMIIMGVISAIAIPRMMKGAENADITGLQADLQVMRSAIEIYRYEHGGNFPSDTDVADQLTKITDAAGVVDPVGGLGPYVVKIPPLKTGANKGATSIGATTDNPPTAQAGTDGYLYNEASGSIWANDTGNLDK